MPQIFGSRRQLTQIKLIDLTNKEDKNGTKVDSKEADAAQKMDTAVDTGSEVKKSVETKPVSVEKDKKEGKVVVATKPPAKTINTKNIPDEGPDDGLKKLLIADSICDNLGRINRLTTHIMRAARIEDVIHAVSTDSINVRGFSIIIIHVGTNNLATDNVEIMRVKYQQLLNAVKMRNRRAIIAISAVLPRPVDFPRSRGKSTMLNKELTNLCMSPALTHSLFFIPSFRPFIKDAQPVKNYYAGDGLHLSPEGVQVLRKFFFNAFRLIVKTKLSGGSYANRY